MKQITKKQHFVPRFYLKQFARDGQVHVFDVRTKRIKKPLSYTSVCYEKFFYAAQTGIQDEVSQAYEDVFGQIEDMVAKALPEVIEQARSLRLTDDDLGILAYFMSVQWLRTSYFRERLQKMNANLMKQVLRITASHPGFREHARSMLGAPDISDEAIDEAQRLFRSGEYDLRHTSNALHLEFISDEKIHGFRNLLLAKKWRIIHAKDAAHFITSDNPISEWMPPARGLFGTTFTDRRHLFPLTPRILIESAPANGVAPDQPLENRLSYHAANEKGVLMFNKVLAGHAHRFAFAPQRGDFERLLETT